MVRKDCRYTNEHEWVRLDGPGHVKIGITDFAQSSLGDIVFVQLPEVGTRLKQMDAFGSVEAVKTVGDLYTPVTGEVVAVNASIAADPAIVNGSPYDDGWMIRATLPDPSELEKLLTPEAYEELVRGLEGEH